MIISINGANTPTPVTYKITERPIKKIVTNSKGDEFIDLVNTKYTITLGWLPLSDVEIIALVASVEGASFSVSFYHKGVLKTGTFQVSGDVDFDMLYMVGVRANWKDFKLTLRQL